MLKDKLVIVRGGGDLATGTIYKLYQCGFKILVLETAHPSAIRRYIAFSEAVYEGSITIEGVTCTHIKDINLLETIWTNGEIPLFVDPKGELIRTLKPWAVIDAIIAKKNLGTTMDMAPVTIALGPGFTAGVDVKTVIETKRGHNLGRLILSGSAAANTGIPGIIGGYGAERVIHAITDGNLYGIRKIGDLVDAGETIAIIQKDDGRKIPVKTSIHGVIRGLIRDGYPVTIGFKIADVDPRKSEKENCFTISDKARCIAGGVLEALMREL